MMRNEPHFIKARVWVWQGDSPWHFITIEKDKAKQIVKDYHWPRRGFGSIPVVVKIGKTEWKTSIFPERGGSYLLPLKKGVRKIENIKVGQTIKLELIVIS